MTVHFNLPSQGQGTLSETKYVGSILVVFGAWQRILDRLFERSGPFPFISGTAFPVCADLVHGRVDFDLIAVRIVELQARITSGAAAPLVKDFHSLGPKKVANFKELRYGRYLEGHMIKPYLAVFGQFVFLFGLKQCNGVVIRPIAKKHHTDFVAVGEFEAHDLRPELGAALDVADTQNHVSDLLDLDGRFFFSHRFPPSMVRQLVFKANS